MGPELVAEGEAQAIALSRSDIEKAFLRRVGVNVMMNLRFDNFE